MTQIEMDMARAVIAMNQKMHKIDWEQRRYEVAKELYPLLLQNYSRSMGVSMETVTPISASHSVKFADALIDELKKLKDG